jgi:putrescine importer
LPAPGQSDTGWNRFSLEGIVSVVTGEGGAAPEGTHLRSNALGLSALVIMGIAYMGLALTAYFNFGIMEGITGPPVPLAFAAVTIAMLPTAASYAVMNNRRPSTGSTFTWLWEATSPPIGIWLGWVLVITYIFGCILQPVMFGLFFNSLLDYFGIGTSYWTATALGLISIVVVAIMTKRDIRISAKVTAIFIAIEAGFVALLAVYIIIKQAIDGNLSGQPLNPGAATHGWTGFQNALLFAVLAIAAFDIVAPMAEESKTPRSLVPKATILVTIGAGVYWVVTSFGLINAVPASTMQGYVQSGEFTPIYLVADHYIGYLRILVPLTGMTAVFAAFTAISIAASRLLYALAREGLAPRTFALTDENRTPWNAQKLVLGCCVILPILIPYTLTCVANIFFHVRIDRASFNPIWHLVLPLIGIAINCYIFYKNFLKTFLIDATSFKYQTSITTVCFALVVLAAIFAVIGIQRVGTRTAPRAFAETDVVDEAVP